MVKGDPPDGKYHFTAAHGGEFAGIRHIVQDLTAYNGQLRFNEEGRLTNPGGRSIAATNQYELDGYRTAYAVTRFFPGNVSGIKAIDSYAVDRVDAEGRNVEK